MLLTHRPFVVAGFSIVAVLPRPKMACGTTQEERLVLLVVAGAEIEADVIAAEAMVERKGENRGTETAVSRDLLKKKSFFSFDDAWPTFFLVVLLTFSPLLSLFFRHR